jgi:hypothetical protein
VTEITKVTSSHKTKRFLVLALLMSLSVGPTILGGALLTSAHARDNGLQGNKNQTPKPNKIASDLSDLLQNKSGAATVKVILQLNQKPSGQLNAMLAANGVKIRKHFDNLNSFALELPASVVDALYLLFLKSLLLLLIAR